MRIALLICKLFTIPNNNNGTFSYSASNTNSATQNTVGFAFNMNAGESMTLGTCGVAGATYLGDTFLRVSNPNGTALTFNDDACSNFGSNLSFVASVSGTHIVRAGCFGNESCTGTIALRRSP